MPESQTRSTSFAAMETSCDMVGDPVSLCRRRIADDGSATGPASADLGHQIPSRTDLRICDRCDCSHGRFRIHDSWAATAFLGMANAAARGMARNSRGKLCPGWRECPLPAARRAVPAVHRPAGTAPAIALWIMLRRGAPLTPRWTAALGALAAAGLGNFCVRLGHPEDVTVMLLVWHAGGVIVLSALASVAGRTF